MITPERQKEIDIENSKASMRIMGRAMAPVILETFQKAQAVTGIPVPFLYLIMRHKPGGDLNKVEDSIIEMRNIATQEKIELKDNAGAAPGPSVQERTKDAFPVLKILIEQYSENWNVTPYDLFITIRIVSGAVAGSAQSMSFEIKTRKGIDPPQSDSIV